MRVVKSHHKANHMELIKQHGKNTFKVKKEKATKKEEFIDKVVNGLNISEDIIKGAEIITLIGKRSLVIENYVKVVECEPERMQIKTKRNYICIEGKDLRIEYLYDVELRITGVIHSFTFEMKERL